MKAWGRSGLRSCGSNSVQISAAEPAASWTTLQCHSVKAVPRYSMIMSPQARQITSSCLLFPSAQAAEGLLG